MRQLLHTLHVCKTEILIREGGIWKINSCLHFFFQCKYLYLIEATGGIDVDVQSEITRWVFNAGSVLVHV